MAGNVKGIVVEIGGDTSGLQKALKDVNKNISSISKELQGVNTLLKLDPKNTTLLTQKQKLLKDEISATSSKLQELVKHQKEVESSGVKLTEEQQKNYRSLQREIILTQEKLKGLITEQSSFTRFGQAVVDTGNKIESMGNKIEQIGQKVSVLSGAVASLFAVGVNYNMDLEKSTKAFETFLGDTEQARKSY